MSKMIVKGKEYAAVSVISGEGAPEVYAASELRKYLGLLGIPEGEGAVVTIRTDAHIGRDGYAVTSGEDGDVTVTGGNGRGVIYGIYALLERYAGVRYYLPGVEKIGAGDMEIGEDFSPISDFRASAWYALIRGSPRSSFL